MLLFGVLLCWLVEFKIVTNPLLRVCLCWLFHLYACTFLLFLLLNRRLFRVVRILIVFLSLLCCFLLNCDRDFYICWFLFQFTIPFRIFFFPYSWWFLLSSCSLRVRVMWWFELCHRRTGCSCSLLPPLVSLLCILCKGWAIVNFPLVLRLTVERVFCVTFYLDFSLSVCDTVIEEFSDVLW